MLSEFLQMMRFDQRIAIKYIFHALANPSYAIFATTFKVLLTLRFIQLPNFAQHLIRLFQFNRHVDG
jgi:hypothetical protein